MAMPSPCHLGLRAEPAAHQVAEVSHSWRLFNRCQDGGWQAPAARGNPQSMGTTSGRRARFANRRDHPRRNDCEGIDMSTPSDTELVEVVPTRRITSEVLKPPDSLVQLRELQADARRI